MRRRHHIIIELQERARKINTEIKIHQKKKRETIEEFDIIIQQKQEDLEFHLALISLIHSNSSNIAEEEEPIEIETRLAESARSPLTLTRAQFQEQKE
jgi:hypothetical protein